MSTRINWTFMVQHHRMSHLSILDFATGSRKKLSKHLLNCYKTSKTNNAFTAEQRLCMTLRFLATGSFQKIIGDSEGGCQATMHNHII